MYNFLAMGEPLPKNFPKGVQVSLYESESENVRIVTFSSDLTKGALGELAVKIGCTPELLGSGLFNGQTPGYVDTDCFYKAVAAAGSLLADPENLVREPEPPGMQYS